MQFVLLLLQRQPSLIRQLSKPSLKVLKILRGLYLVRAQFVPSFRLLVRVNKDTLQEVYNISYSNQLITSLYCFNIQYQVVQRFSTNFRLSVVRIVIFLGLNIAIRRYKVISVIEQLASQEILLIFKRNIILTSKDQQVSYLS